MNHIIRILQITKNLKRGNVKFFVGYIREGYVDYNSNKHDEIDEGVYNYFTEKGFQVNWSYESVYSANNNSTIYKKYVAPYKPQAIPLQIDFGEKLKDAEVTLFFNEHYDLAKQAYLPKKIEIQTSLENYKETENKLPKSIDISSHN
jgi:hypothetical protein